MPHYYAAYFTHTTPHTHTHTHKDNLLLLQLVVYLAFI